MTKFDWRRVLTAPHFDPSLPFIWVLGVGVGLLLGWTMPWAFIVLGLAALAVVCEWCYYVGWAVERERERVRSARNFYD